MLTLMVKGLAILDHITRILLEQKEVLMGLMASLYSLGKISVSVIDLLCCYHCKLLILVTQFEGSCISGLSLAIFLIQVRTSRIL